MLVGPRCLSKNTDATCSHSEHSSVASIAENLHPQKTVAVKPTMRLAARYTSVNRSSLSSTLLFGKVAWPTEHTLKRMKLASVYAIVGRSVGPVPPATCQSIRLVEPALFLFGTFRALGCTNFRLQSEVRIGSGRTTDAANSESRFGHRHSHQLDRSVRNSALPNLCAGQSLQILFGAMRRMDSADTK